MSEDEKVKVLSGLEEKLYEDVVVLQWKYDTYMSDMVEALVQMSINAIKHNPELIKYLSLARKKKDSGRKNKLNITKRRKQILENYTEQTETG